SAIEISKYIKELPVKKIITVAWVHNKAFSAGAMITAACQHVVMSREASYGDCLPIAVTTTWAGGQELVPMGAEERAKMSGPVVDQFEDSAQKNGWNVAGMRAMVVMAAQVHELRHETTGEVVY